MQEHAKLSLVFLSLLTSVCILAGMGLITNSSFVIVASTMVSPIVGPVIGMVRFKRDTSKIKLFFVHRYSDQSPFFWPILLRSKKLYNRLSAAWIGLEFGKIICCCGINWIIVGNNHRCRHRLFDILKGNSWKIKNPFHPSRKNGRQLKCRPVLILRG